MDEDLQRYRHEQASHYLAHITRVLKREKELKERVDTARANMEYLRGIDYSGVRVQTSCRGDKMADDVANVIDYTIEAIAAISDAVDERRRATEVFERLSRAEYEIVLKYRYLHEWDWGEIAGKMNYSCQHIMRLHRLAVIELYEFMPCEFRDPLPQAI